MEEFDVWEFGAVDVAPFTVTDITNLRLNFSKGVIGYIKHELESFSFKEGFILAEFRVVSIFCLGVWAILEL